MILHPATIRFFHAEFANEGPTDDYGVTPSTVVSALDSFLQAPDIFCPDPADQAAVACDLLTLLWRELPKRHKSTELRDLI